MQRDLSDIRTNYSKFKFDESWLSKKPFEIFNLWFDQAQKENLPEYTASVLSTSDEIYGVDSRVVLIKKIEKESLFFFTNYESTKANQIEKNNRVSILFFWKEHERQVKFIGKVKKASKELTESYFSTRPIESQIGAWVSNQSREIENRSELEKRFEIKKEELSKLDKIPVPNHWGGYEFTPDLIEFWQGRPSRFHDRILFSKDKKGTWQSPIRLQP